MFFRTNRRWPCVDVRQAVLRTEEILENSPLKAQALSALPCPKALPEKVVLAWWLGQQTTVPLRWVRERLKMGHYTRVTQALSRMERHPSRKLKHLRQRLERGLPSEQ